MHIVVAALYSVVLWLALTAFLYQVDGPALEVLAWGPFIVSAVVVVLYVIEVLIFLARVVVNRIVDGVREWWAVSRQ